MRFSTRTTYGLRAMVKLARHYDRGYLSLAKIARDENISLNYLERIFSGLKKQGLVISEKGTNGGYRLAQAPAKISVYEIVKTLEGKLIPFHCLSADGRVTCTAAHKCGASGVLVQVQKAVNETLRGIDLASL